jgi:predicted NAD/FAD-dependent oxidoreductase
MSGDSLPLRVAIIGGGISGLSSAYYLLKQARPGDRPLHIDIYERKATLGGNADTVVVDLGDYLDGQGMPHAFLRWADLGVNDVNLATYVKLKKVMQEIGYLDNMKPLQDTTCYFNTAGSLTLTDDEALRDGVSNPHFSLANADDGKLSPLIRVVHQTALNLLGSITPQYTVGHFFSACIAQPAPMLGKAAAQLKIQIDWDDPKLTERLSKVRDDIYYPRIAAMYFTDERGPATLPLQSPFEYYRLQEGQGADAANPDRRYFEHGAQKWLDALADHLLAQSDAQVTIRIHTNAHVRVQVLPGRVNVLGESQPPARYELCVLGTHADDTLKLLSFDHEMMDWGRRIASVLSQVTYTRSYAVCHTYGAKLPRNINVWRTYNVLQREPTDATFPYRMTYVENLHQNDPVNPQYSRAGLPLFLTSIVKSLHEIPHESMLDRVRDTLRLDAGLLDALPRATQRHLRGETLHTGYRAAHDMPHPKLADKAWTVFKHNVLNADCIAAQESINNVNLGVAQQIGAGQQPPCALLFGGGWTKGAGLQEQCLQQSELIAGWILPALRGAVSAEPSLERAAAATTA